MKIQDRKRWGQETAEHKPFPLENEKSGCRQHASLTPLLQMPCYHNTFYTDCLRIVVQYDTVRCTVEFQKKSTDSPGSPVTGRRSGAAPKKGIKKTENASVPVSRTEKKSLKSFEAGFQCGFQMDVTEKNSAV